MARVVVAPLFTKSLGPDVMRKVPLHLGHTVMSPTRATYLPLMSKERSDDDRATVSGFVAQDDRRVVQGLRKLVCKAIVSSWLLWEERYLHIRGSKINCIYVQ